MAVVLWSRFRDPFQQWKIQQNRSNHTAMFRQGLVFLGGVVTTGVAATAFAVSNTTSARFDAIFNRGEKHHAGECYDRVEFKRALKNNISLSPTGIIFVTGRIGAGKTTVIQSVLAERDHVAYVNWRGPDITTEQELVATLNKAFQINGFKEYVRSFVKLQSGVFGAIWQFFHLPSLISTLQATIP